jgi:hypothetical protein
MRAWNYLTRQMADFLLYFLIPGLSVFLPTAWSRSLLARISACGWLLSAKSDTAWNMAQEFAVAGSIDPGDEMAWKKRWKQIELLDVRDLYLMSFGRSRAVLAEIEYGTPLETAKDRVMIGMHWGPSISTLKMMAEAGLAPAFLYRSPATQALRRRPFYYLFLCMASRHLEKTMNERAIEVGGAGRKLGPLLDQPGSVVVLMDAPPMEGRSTLSGPVLNLEAVFGAGLPTILAEKHKEYMLYALSLHPDGSLRKKLELRGPFVANDAQTFVQDYAGFLSEHLSSDPVQWRIWHAAGQFFKT